MQMIMIRKQHLKYPTTMNLMSYSLLKFFHPTESSLPSINNLYPSTNIFFFQLQIDRKKLIPTKNPFSKDSLRYRVLLEFPRNSLTQISRIDINIIVYFCVQRICSVLSRITSTWCTCKEKESFVYF